MLQQCWICRTDNTKLTISSERFSIKCGKTETRQIKMANRKKERERETEGCSHLDQSQSEVRLKQSKPGSLSTLNWKLFKLSFIGSLYVFYECKRESRGTSKRVHKNTTNIIMTVNTLSTFITIKLWNYQVFRQFTKIETFCPNNCIA